MSLQKNFIKKFNLIEFLVMRTFCINKQLGLHMNFRYINLVLRRILKARMHNSPLKSSKLIYAFLIQKQPIGKQ